MFRRLIVLVIGIMIFSCAASAASTPEFDLQQSLQASRTQPNLLKVLVTVVNNTTATPTITGETTTEFYGANGKFIKGLTVTWRDKVRPGFTQEYRASGEPEPGTAKVCLYTKFWRTDRKNPDAAQRVCIFKARS